MEDRFIHSLKKVLEIKDHEVNLSDSFREYPEWHAFAYLQVLTMLDIDYDIVIRPKELGKLTTVLDLLHLVKEKTKKTQ